MQTQRNGESRRGKPWRLLRVWPNRTSLLQILSEGAHVNSTLKIQKSEAVTLIEKIKAEINKRAEAKANRHARRRPSSVTPSLRSSGAARRTCRSRVRSSRVFRLLGELVTSGNGSQGRHKDDGSDIRLGVRTQDRSRSDCAVPCRTQDRGGQADVRSRRPCWRLQSIIWLATPLRPPHTDRN
jgi:hypothetical protein